MAASVRRRTILLRVPRGALVAASRVAGRVAALRGKPHPFPEDRLHDYLAAAWTCDISRAREELGYTPQVNLRTGWAETMAWYRNAGWV
jgi:nucleoside-diphosphate-sugar epimerase